MIGCQWMPIVGTLAVLDFVSLSIVSNFEICKIGILNFTMAPIYHAISDAISRKKHMCIVKTAAWGGFISVHNSQWA